MVSPLLPPGRHDIRNKPLETILVVALAVGLVIEGGYFFWRMGMVTRFLEHHSSLVLANHEYIKSNQEKIDAHLRRQDDHMDKYDVIFAAFKKHIDREEDEWAKNHK